MRKKIICTLSIIAIVFSMISIFISIYCNVRLLEPVKWDLLGVLAGILSILVTVLIGWQLYNIISFERRINKLKQEIKRENIKQLEGLKKEVEYKIYDAEAQLLYRQSLVAEAIDQYYWSLECIMNAIEKTTYNPYTSPEIIEKIDDALMDLIHKIKGESVFSTKDLERYITIIKKANLEHSNDILKFLFEVMVKT